MPNEIPGIRCGTSNMEIEDGCRKSKCTDADCAVVSGTSMGAERRELRRSVAPLCQVRTRFGQAVEVTIEFLRDNTLVLPIIVANDVALFGNREHVNRAGIIKTESDLGQHIGCRIEFSIDGQTLAAITQRAISAFDQQSAFHVSAVHAVAFELLRDWRDS